MGFTIPENKTKKQLLDQEHATPTKQQLLVYALFDATTPNSTTFKDNCREWLTSRFPNKSEFAIEKFITTFQATTYTKFKKHAYGYRKQLLRLTNPYDRKYFSAEIVIEEVEKDQMKPVRLPSAKYGPSISQSLTTRSQTASKINDSPDDEKDPLALSEKERMKPVKKEATNYTAPLISQSLTTGSRTAFKIYDSPDAKKDPLAFS